ncbi:hypothetical protein OH77DRAFT_1533394 [Trametes cingulata]|nr:hypothetical protein OH77DRAFT_1533394 [Trametes cingulata]
MAESMISHPGPCPLVDQKDRVFGVLAGRPRDEDAWGEIQRQLLTGGKHPEHRRGTYATVTAGISYGGGQTCPANFTHSGKEQSVVERLLSNDAVRRIAGFGDSCLKLFAPQLHAYYGTTLKTLQKSNRDLRRNFEDNVFAAATFNLGPRVVTVVHTDHMNIPAGWCAITAICNYDPQNGGHLLLWDLKLMIEFPQGALILIPSAILSHSNTNIGANESRYSFTQYSAGGLFCWVACGCMSQKNFFRDGQTYSVAGKDRWQQGLTMFSTLEEFRARCTP